MEIYDLDLVVDIICKLNPYAPGKAELRNKIIESAKNMEKYPDATASATLGYSLQKDGEGGYQLFICPFILVGKF